MLFFSGHHLNTDQVSCYQSHSLLSPLVSLPLITFLHLFRNTAPHGSKCRLVKCLVSC